VLHDVGFEAKPGETVAIVGPSGSGKTTLTMLLQRHYPLECGSISIDGIDVRDLSQHALRRQIGVVHQDVDLFNETVRDNIGYGLPTASDQDIERAARAAYAHEFIVQLPEGYDTVLGEHGSRLSGGQRQRLAIARAILADPPILIFDEATSALDAESEAHVQTALRELTRHRTTFVIAHRLATVVSASRIVVMDAGRIEGVGTHGELVQRCELYRRLVRCQSSEGLATSGEWLWRYELASREVLRIAN
jgi:ABC-type multidrug transport system fused ATPase/permease subunit